MTDQTAAVDTGDVPGPHAGRPVVRDGPTLADADAAVVFVHGRGATARGILGLADDLGLGPETARLAPAAARREWYPAAFTAPTADNQPYLDSALALVGATVAAATAAVGTRRTALVGFSQGACLAAEWTARNPARYGGLAVLSGGLIGPPGTAFDYEGSLADENDATPVFLGCSDDDPHIPVERVHETRDALTAMDADVDERIYSGTGHGVVPDEIDAVGVMLADL